MTSELKQRIADLKVGLLFASGDTRARLQEQVRLLTAELRATLLPAAPARKVKVRDNQSDVVERVLKAYDQAKQGGNKTVDCYLATVREWQRLHPDHARKYAAQRAVDIVLEHRVLPTLSTERER